MHEFAGEKQRKSKKKVNKLHKKGKLRNKCAKSFPNRINHSFRIPFSKPCRHRKVNHYMRNRHQHNMFLSAKKIRKTSPELEKK